MNFINYISNAVIPFTILIIVVYGLIEKNKVYDTFVDGAKEGIEIVLKFSMLFLFTIFNTDGND